MMNPYTSEGQAEILHYLQTSDVSAFEVLTAFFMMSLFPVALIQTLRPYMQQFINSLEPYYWISIAIAILLYIVYVGLRIYIFNKSIKEKRILLQVVPPERTAQSPEATQELLTALHDISRYPKTYYKFFREKRTISFELVATKEEGIQYFIQVPEEDTSIVTRTILSSLPDAKVQRQEDYLPIENNKITLLNIWTSISDIILCNDFFFPLKHRSSLQQHDPISFLTGQMTKLNDNEMMMLQIITAPLTMATHKRLSKKRNQVFKAVQTNCLLLPYRSGWTPKSIAWLPLKALRFLLLFSIGLLFWQINLVLFVLTFGGVRMLVVEVFRRKDTVVDLAPVEVQLYTDISAKLNEPLFETTIRLFVATEERQDNSLRNRGILSALATFDYGNIQSFQHKVDFLRYIDRIETPFTNFKLHKRQLSLRNNPILSVSELGNIFHLPYTPTTKTEGLVKSKFISLPAPLTFKNRKTGFDIQFGTNVHNDEETRIGLTKNERKRHMYIIGGTGTGKTTLLASMIKQDIENGKGLCIIDPHGDLSKSILHTIPRHRIKDVVYFNPMDRSYPFGLNLLELLEGLSEEALQDEKEIITSNIVSVFHKLYGSKYFGPRMEHVLRYSILAALETENPTFFTIQKLLTDKVYRNKLVPTLTDPVVKDFWQNEFKRLGSYQQAEMTLPITNKLGRFLASPLCRNIMGQQQSTIDFDEIMNKGKILICSLPKGSIGEDNSALFGVLTITKLQLAALHRVGIPETQRKEFYLYVDEFQNFATPAFSQILSEARKYGLSAILAHQTIAQLEDHNLSKIILANTGTTVCFRTSSPLDEDYLLPLYKPFVSKGEIANLPSFTFYGKIHAIKPYDPFSGETEEWIVKENPKRVAAIIAHSQKQYGVPRKEIEDRIAKFYMPHSSGERTKKSIQKQSSASVQMGGMME